MITTLPTEVTTMTMTSGSYSLQQVRDFLTTTLKREAGFHSLQNYISQIRHEEDCEQAQVNLTRIQDMADNIERLLTRAKNEHRRLRVKSVLVLSLEEGD